MRYTWYRAKAPVIVEYGVNYAPGEGQGSGNLDYVNAGTTITLKTPQELGFSAVEGKMFDAWKINEVRYEPGDEYLVNSDTIITALWKNVPVTATALSATYNGGNILAGTKINPSGIVITMTYSNSTQTPIDAGSVEYWYNGTQIQEPINYVFGVELIGTRTITVKYLGLETTFDVKVVGYKISFNANDGSGTISDVEYVGEYTLPSCSFTAPTGKQFKCWAEGSASGQQYDVGDEYDVTANMTFYAVWEDIPGQHVHSHGSEWKTDAENHWNECACGDKANVAPHADTNNDEKCDTCYYAMPKAPSNNETEKPTEKPTDATESENDDSTETEKKNGCGSTLALSSLAIVAVVGSALVIKKKED